MFEVVFVVLKKSGSVCEFQKGEKKNKKRRKKEKKNELDKFRGEVKNPLFVKTRT